MTLALSTKTSPAEPSFADELRSALEDMSDPSAAARAVARILRAHLELPTVSVYRYDAAGEVVVLLASEPASASSVAPGARLPLGSGMLATAVRAGEVQKIVNSYVEPDFVRSLPGETRSEIVVPIRSEDEVLGAIQLEYGSSQRPGDSHVAHTELAARELASVFRSPRVVAVHGDEAAAARLERAAELAAIAHHLAHNGDLRSGLERIAHGATRIVESSTGAILLRHESRQMLEVGAIAGDAHLEIGDLLPLDSSLAGRVAADARPRICSAFGKPEIGNPEMLTSDDEGRGIRNALLVPLAAAGKVYGVLTVLNHPTGDYSAEDVEALQSLADHAAAIEAMRTVGPLRQRLSDSSTIAEVGRAVTGTLGLDEVLAVVVRAAEMLVRSRCTAVALTTADELSLELAATAGTLLTRQGDTIPVIGSLLGWAVINGETVVADSLAEDPRRHESEPEQGPVVILPIESRNKVRGVLMAARAVGAQPPSESDVDALRKLAAYAAIAIENATLYREQTELSRKLQVQTEELERAYAELRTSQERLLVSEKMAALGRVTAGIAHEINSPLGGILNCLQMAQSYVGEYRSSIGDPEVGPEDHEAIAKDLTEALGLAEQSTRKVAQFVRTIKGQTRTGEEEKQAFDPAEEIEGVTALLQHQLRDRNIELDLQVENGLLVQGDSSKFGLIVQNLLSNAIDAFEGADGQVELRWLARDGKAVLEVQDHGTGIPESIRPRIYDYLFTTKDIGQGTGLGLSMVHSIVTSHFEGDIDFTSEEGVGTTFLLTFPIATAQD